VFIIVIVVVYFITDSVR